VWNLLIGQAAELRVEKKNLFFSSCGISIVICDYIFLILNFMSILWREISFISFLNLIALKIISMIKEKS